MENEKSVPVLFYIAIAITIIAVLLCIYYLIPNINHMPIPAYARPTLVHYKYVGLAGGIAALGLIAAFFTRPTSGAK